MTETRPAWYPGGARDKHLDADTEPIGEPELAAMIARRELPDTWEEDGPDGIELDRSWLPWLDGITDLVDVLIRENGKRLPNRSVAVRVASSAHVLAAAVREFGSIRIIVLTPADAAYNRLTNEPQESTHG